MNKSTWLLLQVYNRKRQGELSRTLKVDFDESRIYRASDPENMEDLNRLSPAAQEEAKQYVRLSVTGKRGETLDYLFL